MTFFGLSRSATQPNFSREYCRRRPDSSSSSSVGNQKRVVGALLRACPRSVSALNHAQVTHVPTLAENAESPDGAEQLVPVAPFGRVTPEELLWIGLSASEIDCRHGEEAIENRGRHR
jgi:hypothetical protein